MNGIVASLTLPHVRRLIRAGLVLACCILSVSLIGAVHTRTWNGASALKTTPTAKAVLKAEVTVKVPSIKEAVVTSNDPDDEHEADHDDDVHEGVLQLAAFQIEPTLRTLTATLTTPAAPVVPTTPSASSFRVVWMEVTAYCPCKKCCGPRARGVTASGRPVSFNGGLFVAADKGLPFNTKLLIPGYAGGQVVPVLDRGGAIKGAKLDVFFPTHEQARQWGRRFIPVTVYN